MVNSEVLSQVSLFKKRVGVLEMVAVAQKFALGFA